MIVLSKEINDSCSPCEAFYRIIGHLLFLFKTLIKYDIYQTSTKCVSIKLFPLYSLWGRLFSYYGLIKIFLLPPSLSPSLLSSFLCAVSHLLFETIFQFPVIGSKRTQQAVSTDWQKIPPLHHATFQMIILLGKKEGKNTDTSSDERSWVFDSQGRP